MGSSCTFTGRSTLCAACAPNEIGVDGISCVACPPGQYQPENEYTGLSCNACVAGEYLSGYDCLVCPAGKWSFGATCADCTAGKYLIDNAGTDPTAHNSEALCLDCDSKPIAW